ncbi:hypothetical protein CBS101457_003718 [Exobasidium rhododendri]|nr:hypothetical protein CBS101457_003718 [Exobasidium rhododendri]
MPKVTSLSAPASNKENIAPTARSRKAKQAYDEEAEIDERVDQSSAPKRPKSNTGASSNGQTYSTSSNINAVAESSNARLASSSSDSASVKRVKVVEQGQSYNSDQRKSKRELILEEKLVLLTNERDQVQSQFDDLREVRQTAPEKRLSEWKKLAEQRDRQAEEYITRLKEQIDSLQTKGNGMSSDSVLTSDERKHWAVRENDAEEEVTRSTKVTSASSKDKNSTNGLGVSDERAVRKLYEDLTGLIVSKVELLQGREGHPYRAFHAIFGSSGYYSLEMRLEESESVESSRPRQDLIYVPALDSDRDAEILDSGRLPVYLKESLRFERSTAVRFMNTLHKKLDRQVRRGN